MTTPDARGSWAGAPVLGRQGELLGHVEGTLVDDATGRPTWVAVLGRRHTALVPLTEARHDGAALHVPYVAEQLRTAPRHVPGRRLGDAQAQDLCRHYGVLPDPPVPPPAMVRSEERLWVDVQRRPFVRVRLVRYIVTEDVTFTVPVRREEVRLEEVPLDAEWAAGAVDADPADEHVAEMVLHREQVSFTTHTVPVERVRLVRQVVIGEQQVTAQLGTEHVEIEQA